MSATAITARLRAVRGRIAAAAEYAGRDPGGIALIAVSKRQPVDAIRAAYEAGQRDFGESYVQEALEKIDALSGLPDIRWHFIGRVQSNKTREIASAFAWVHGLSDVRHARRLNAQRLPEASPLAVCLQIDLGGETTKNGIAPEAAATLLADCAGLERLAVRGLMTLPAPAVDEVAKRAPFARLRQLRDRLRSARTPLETLSMGMSDDLEAAVLEGATMVRIGTAVFGSRPYT